MSATPSQRNMGAGVRVNSDLWFFGGFVGTAPPAPSNELARLRTMATGHEIEPV